MWIQAIASFVIILLEYGFLSLMMFPYMYSLMILLFPFLLYDTPIS
jgi:hypothetical protein